MFIPLGDIVEANGKTIRENNREIPHNIPVGTLCDVKYDRWHGGGACEKVHARLWVVEHRRDCDGSVLYALSPKRREDWFPVPKIFEAAVFGIQGGFSEESLTVVEVTDPLRDGYDALEWPEAD